MPLRFAQLRLEELDARTLPSTTLPLAPTQVLSTVVSPASHPLHGAGAGSYVGNSLVVDAGLFYKLAGMVQLNDQGSFKVTGWVQGVGMIAQGRATGQLVLQNESGTITLTLHGGMQPGFSPIPHELVYSISGGTGTYKHLGGYGVVAIGFMPAPTAFGLPPRGEFTLSVH